MTGVQPCPLPICSKMESKLSGKMVMSEKTEKRVTMTEKENKTTKVIGKRSRPEKIDGVVMIKKGDHSLDQYLGSYLKEGKDSKRKRVSLSANRKAPTTQRTDRKKKVKKNMEVLKPRIKSWESMLGRKLNYFELDQVVEAAESAGDISE